MNRTAAGLGATPAQVTLAWILVQKPRIVPIPGSPKASLITKKLVSAALDLTAATRVDLTFAAAAIPALGARCPEHIERTMGL